MTTAVQAPTTQVLLGLRFIVDDRTPFGDAVLSPRDLTSWEVSTDTWEALCQRSPAMKHGVITMIRNAQSEGRRLVKGIVQPGARHGRVAAPRAQRSNLEDLAARCRGLVVQIATLSDAGPIPEGQMSQLSRTYAALQAERDEVMEALSEIEDNLSIGRAIIFEYTMPNG